MADPTRVVVLSPTELHGIIREAVAEALAEHAPLAAPALLDRAGAARFLGVSIATLDRLVKDGRLPHLHVGDARRFEAHVLIAHLRHATEAAEAARNATGKLRVVEGGSK